MAFMMGIRVLLFGGSRELSRSKRAAD